MNLSNTGSRRILRTLILMGLTCGHAGCSAQTPQTQLATVQTGSKDLKMNTLEETQAVLQTSRNQADLEQALLHLAASSQPVDLKTLEAFLTNGASLKRLDTVSDPAVKTKRFGHVIAELGRNKAPGAGSTLHALLASGEVSADRERVLHLLRAAAAVKPITPERVQMFQRVEPATFCLTNLNLLLMNASHPAMAEAKREILAKPHSIPDEAIVDVMHNCVVPNRTDAELTEWGLELADAGISDVLKVGLFESFFDYRYEAWYRTKRFPPKPPKWETAALPALKNLLRLAEESKHASLPEPLRQKITEEASSIREAVAKNQNHP